MTSRKTAVTVRTDLLSRALFIFLNGFGQLADFCLLLQERVTCVLQHLVQVTNLLFLQMYHQPWKFPPIFSWFPYEKKEPFNWINARTHTHTHTHTHMHARIHTNTWFLMWNSPSHFEGSGPEWYISSMLGVEIHHCGPKPSILNAWNSNTKTHQKI